VRGAVKQPLSVTWPTLELIPRRAAFRYNARVVRWRQAVRRQIAMSHEPSGTANNDTPRFLGRVSERQSVILVLAVLGAVAALLIVPGVFTVDETITWPGWCRCVRDG